MIMPSRRRHNLPIISVLDEAARINENGGPYKGQDQFEARKKLWADMKKAGLVIKEEKYLTTIPAFTARRRNRRADDQHAMVC